MPKCKICDSEITSGVMVHADCWRDEANKTVTAICADYCKWPDLAIDEQELESICDNCDLAKLFNLVVE